MFKKALTTLLLAGFTKAAPQDERVKSIPGYQEFDNYEMYSGYVPIAKTSKKIHYAFLTS
jgi:hypothetical protein